MKKCIAFILILSYTACAAQEIEGVITYQRTQFWSKILPKLTYLSKEQMDRELRTWGSNDEGWKSKYELVFNGTESRYTELNETSEYGWNGRDSDFMLYRNQETGLRSEIEEIGGKTYLIGDSLHMPKWKVLNEIREISGKICMKAFTYDSIRKQNVVAWFTGDIAVNTGPERYFGLPGAILELDIDDGAVVVTALKIEMKPVNELLKFTKKVKGKKISGNDYNLLVTSILRDAMKAHRYPYWSMRF